MKSIRIMIVDDDAEAAAVMQAYCEKIPRLTVACVTTSPREALAKLDELEIDLLLLDVEMQPLDGLEMLELLRDRMRYGRTAGPPLKVILCTAYERYAVNGFDHQVSDFLLKPIPFHRFAASIRQVERDLRLKPTVAAINDDYYYFLVKTGSRRGRTKINFDRIIYIEAAENGSVLHIDKNESVECKDLMKKIYEILPRNVFMQIHKGFIISLDYFKEYDQNKVYMDGVKMPLPVGNRRLFRTFFDWMEEHSL